MTIEKPNILVIVGPTASGKSDLAVKLARILDGEIISADSRQVYKGMDIGSGKITRKEMENIPHHLLDVAKPSDNFTVSEYQTLAKLAIDEILNRKKIPIIVGGTGFYIQSIVENITLPEVKPNQELRQQLDQESTEKLFSILDQLDHERALKIDKQNRRRLIRAIEIATALGQVPTLEPGDLEYNFTIIGIKPEDETLKLNIKKRLLSRLEIGMIEEVENLNKNGLSWTRLEAFGLEYRYIAQFLQGKITREEMTGLINNESWKYAKRQMTWFKRNPDITWFSSNQDLDQILETIKQKI